MKKILFILCGFLLAQPALAEVVTKEINYSDGETSMRGFIAYDDAIKGKRPGVLVVHEWWGHDSYARNRAIQLAGKGYTALALDMYGEGKQASHPEDAMKFMKEVKGNMPMAEKRFKAALKILQDHETTDSARIAAMGYCMGGSIVLDMARLGLPLKAVASFHGNLGTGNPAKKGDVKGKIRVYNGADDPFVKPESIDAFKKEMKAAKVDYKFYNYKGAKHSFTNPEATKRGQEFKLPLEYNRDADMKSWDNMLKFFKKTL